MAVHAAGSPNAMRLVGSRGSTIMALIGCGELLTVVVGVLGLLGATWPRHMLESCINIHVLFTSLLCSLVLARYPCRVGGLALMPAADARELSRQLSRRVYLVLYIVIGVRLTIGILGSLWQGSAVDFNLLDEQFRHGPDGKSFDPKDDFQLFLGTGLLALVAVRVLAFRVWLRFGDIAATAKALGRRVHRVPYNRSPASPKPGRI